MIKNDGTNENKQIFAFKEMGAKLKHCLKISNKY